MASSWPMCGTAEAAPPARKRHHTPPCHIYVKLIGAGAPLQLTHDPLFDQDPAWSPDGCYIAFIPNRNSSDPDGSRLAASTSRAGV